MTEIALNILALIAVAVFIYFTLKRFLQLTWKFSRAFSLYGFTMGFNKGKFACRLCKSADENLVRRV